jgi:lysophospholipase L1-like esterase
MQGDPATKNIAVANQAAGGNRILADGLGPNALGRIDRDVLSQSGVKYAMIFEGVNDIGVASPDRTNQSIIYQRVVSAYDQMITRMHAQGIPVFGATITPFSGANATLQPYSNPVREETRQQINAWIRNSGRFDEVVDFDRILANASAPDQLSALYDSGDYLHPNPDGYQAIADAFPLDVFERWTSGVSGFT